MKKLTFICFVLVSFYAKSQSATNIWKDYYKDSQLAILSTTTNCVLPSEGIYEENVYLSLSNLSSKTITVSYDVEKVYNGKCYNCAANSPEFHYTFQLKPYQTIKGTCALEKIPQLQILSRFTKLDNPLRLDGFKLKNISIQ